MAFDKSAQFSAYSMASQTVPKTRQIVMLYDGAIRFSKQAQEAIERKDYAERFNLLVKVSDIIMNLQAALDFNSGGDIAKLLYDYYSSLDARIQYIHRKNDVKLLDSVIVELKQMRDAWSDIDENFVENNLQEVAKSNSPAFDINDYNLDAEPTPTETANSSSVDVNKPVFVSA